MKLAVSLRKFCSEPATLNATASLFLIICLDAESRNVLFQSLVSSSQRPPKPTEYLPSLEPSARCSFLFTTPAIPPSCKSAVGALITVTPSNTPASKAPNGFDSPTAPRDKLGIAKDWPSAMVFAKPPGRPRRVMSELRPWSSVLSCTPGMDCMASPKSSAGRASISVAEMASTIDKASRFSLSADSSELRTPVTSIVSTSSFSAWLAFNTAVTSAANTVGVNSDISTLAEPPINSERPTRCCF